MTKLFDEREAAQRIGCSVALIRKWRLVGRGPAYIKIDRLVRYAPADIDAFIESRRIVTGGTR